jgi:hypothetical protein
MEKIKNKESLSKYEENVVVKKITKGGRTLLV